MARVTWSGWQGDVPPGIRPASGSLRRYLVAMKASGSQAGVGRQALGGQARYDSPAA